MTYNFFEENSQFLKSINAISESGFYKEVTPELGYQHKIGHIQKVMLLSQIIAQNEDLDEKQVKILLASAAFHDSGRTRDRDNGEHGVSSAEIAGNYFMKNPNNPYGITQSEIGIIQTAIAYHVINENIPGKVDESRLMKLCLEYGVNIKENFENVKQISAILKDADALDRARFSSRSSSPNSLDSSMLRTKTAKMESVIEFAREINQTYATYVLRENYPNEPIEQGDSAKTLQFLRYNYKIKNGGVRKIENEISVKTAITMFRKILENTKMRAEVEDDEREL